jgi:hypothetical protein
MELEIYYTNPNLVTYAAISKLRVSLAQFDNSGTVEFRRTNLVRQSNELLPTTSGRSSHSEVKSMPNSLVY